MKIWLKKINFSISNFAKMLGFFWKKNEGNSMGIQIFFIFLGF